ncbi:MAG: DUF3054 domain-containing protein [Anaerolineales bacterium]|jgi:hypothetical protein
MDNNRKTRLRWFVILLDIVVYLLVTLIGFTSHDALLQAPLLRMLATFVPFTTAWFIAAPWLGLFRFEIIRERRYLPRVLMAVVLAAPLGATLRGFWLGSPILPAFVLVMAAVSGLAMLLWRALLQFIISRSTAAS